MELKIRISSFIKQLLMNYHLTQQELADILKISPGSLSAYVKARELPRVDIIINIADLGGISVDDLLKTNKSPEKKEIIVNINDSAVINGVGGGVFYGPIYQNTTVKSTHPYTYESGDLTEEQASRIKDLVNEIVELEKIVKQKPNSHAAVYNSLKKLFKVVYYRKIGEKNFEQAIAYLQRWKGRLKVSKSLPKKEPDVYRKKRYADIFTISKKELGWSKKDVDAYIYEIYDVSSIRDLDNKQLENLYQRIHAAKRRSK